jgi:hypothetical protein
MPGHDESEEYPPLHLRVELVWQDETEGDAPSIYLTSDGRVLLQGRTVSEDERAHFKIPPGSDLISVDRRLIKAIKEML